MFGFKRRKRPQPETGVSVVMKRQVPIRHSEEARSWIGGLPQMPERIKWPRAESGTPLAFAAQICCADLPENLWNGLGPRKGWLLVFAEPEEFLEDTENDLVQVLHIKELGPERQPPEDMPFWRFEFAGPRVSHDMAPGLPKSWRKWPVDLLVQRYSLESTDWVMEGPPRLSPEQLYGAPGPDHEYAICAVGTIKLDRPLTWRGAVMALADKRSWYTSDRDQSSHVQTEAPEPDQDGFSEEFQRRLDARPEMHNTEPGYYWGQQKAREEETAKLKAERRTGWIERAFVAMDRDEEQWAAKQQKNLDELEAARQSGDETLIEHHEGYISYYESGAKERAEQRAYLTELLTPFRSPEGEAAITAEIEESGRQHGEWIKRQIGVLDRLIDEALKQDPDASLPPEEWDRIQSELSAEPFDYIQRSYGISGLLRRRTDRMGIDVSRNGVIVEELLDFYTSGDPRFDSLPAEVREDFEARLRNNGLVHRLGGHRDVQQGENSADDSPLLIQLASDDAVGWLWADVGCLYITMEEDHLHKSKFHKTFAWLEGG